MLGTQSTIWNKLGRLGLGGQAGVVSVVVLIAWLISAPLAYAQSEVPGLIASATGAGLCLAGAELALLITSLLGATSQALSAIAIGMVCRAFLPLLFGVILHLRVPALAQAGMIFYLLVFYMLTLGTETVLMLAQIRSNGASRKAV